MKDQFSLIITHRLYSHANEAIHKNQNTNEPLNKKRDGKFGNNTNFIAKDKSISLKHTPN